jgi:uncharacterized protein YjcR
MRTVGAVDNLRLKRRAKLSLAASLYDRMQASEIAERFGVKPASIKQRNRRARRQAEKLGIIIPTKARSTIKLFMPQASLFF